MSALSAIATYLTSNLPIMLIVLIAMWFGIGIVALLFLLRWKRDKEERPEVYVSRDEMSDRTGGGLREDLRKCSRAWCAFESGQHLMTLGDLRRKVDKLILADPKGCGLESMLEMLGDNDSPNTYSPSIKEATKFYKSKTKWAKGRFLNVIICDPEEEDGWARLQVYLPGLQADYWPNITVYNKRTPTLYSNIKKAYDVLWDKSEVPSQDMSF